MEKSLLDIIKSSYSNDELNRIMDWALNDSIEQLAKRKRNTVAFLYLRQAVEENISIAEAFEKYQWAEEQIDPRYHVCNGIEYGVYLVPRRDKLDNKKPYRDSAFNLLELIKNELHIKD